MFKEEEDEDDADDHQFSRLRELVRFLFLSLSLLHIHLYNVSSTAKDPLGPRSILPRFRFRFSLRFTSLLSNLSSCSSSFPTMSKELFFSDAKKDGESVVRAVEYDSLVFPMTIRRK